MKWGVNNDASNTGPKSFAKEIDINHVNDG